VSARRIPASLTGALWALGAQGSQAIGSFLIMALAARSLGIEELGKLGVLYGVLVLCAATTSGFVGDSLTVLDRSGRRLRAGMQLWLLTLSCACGVLVPTVSLTVGFVSGIEALLLGLAVAAYLIEDVLRRLLMAHLGFARIVVMDLSVTCVALSIVWLQNVNGLPSLAGYLAAIACGQTAGIIVGAALVPRTDRYLVRFRGADWKAVAAYGCWRAAQQMLRPGLMTAMRLALMILVTLAATGQLEIARIYAAPAMLFVGGISSYLFAAYAKNRASTVAALLAQADRALLVVLGITATGAAVALWALPIAGPLATGQTPDFLAVAGWLAYAASVAVVSPYGALAAIKGSAKRVFALRLADTLVSLAGVVLILHLTGNFALAPWAAALGSGLGGTSIRLFLLIPLKRDEMQKAHHSAPYERQSGTHV
jgi:O-antigen/teichoic acid export membrane protein